MYRSRFDPFKLLFLINQTIMIFIILLFKHSIYDGHQFARFLLTSISANFLLHLQFLVEDLVLNIMEHLVLNIDLLLSLQQL